VGFELIVFLALAASVAGWLFVERLALERALHRLPVRILVNGSRGKSTVVRLIAGALREAGRLCVARTTGSAARLILPDGSEEQIPRAGRARISEVIGTLRRAARVEADAVVVECMAIQPALQRLLAERIVQPTITVITNVRDDHLEEMGPSLEDVAASFAGALPRAGLVVTSEGPFTELLSRETARRGSRFVLASPIALDGCPWEEENTAQAAAVAAALGISEAAARLGMRSARADLGAFRLMRLAVSGDKRLVIADAFAANDPTSTAAIIEGLRASGQLPGPLTAVYNHRRDRLPRALRFARWLAEGYRVSTFATIVAVGDLSVPFLRALRRGGVPRSALVDASGIWDPQRVMGRIAAAAATGSIVAMGNIAGLGLALARLWERLENAG
jgi:poly-gamma-glutamate synthase PgsB/CapB